MYNKVIPEVQKIREKFGLFTKMSFPECYLTIEEKGLIFIENLQKKGYEMLQRPLGEGMWQNY